MTRFIGVAGGSADAAYPPSREQAPLDIALALFHSLALRIMKGVDTYHYAQAQSMEAFDF
jgi:hypothetical protein